MDDSSTIPAEEGAAAPLAAHPEPAPILLALPSRRMETQSPSSQASNGPCLEQLQAIETESGPRVETALLLDLLTRSPGLGQALADPLEVHTYHNPLAGVNAYKHRLHALRCEYVNLRLHFLERCEVAEKRVQFLEAALEEMRASRAWKLVEKCSRLRRIVLGGLGGWRRG